MSVVVEVVESEGPPHSYGGPRTNPTSSRPARATRETTSVHGT